jgi:phosphohistidine phosphatase
MRLYVVQHGDALSAESDPERSLSARGRSDVERLAAFLKGRSQVARIWHSGKTRARQTAELLDAAVGTGARVEARPGIDPLDPVEAFAAEVQGWEEDALVAGHQPFMGKLVARLVRGTAEPEVARFDPGTAICLERAADGRWIVQWMLRPELFG